MALFPTVPFGASQASISGPLFTISNFKYPIRRGVRWRTGQHPFCDFSRQKYKKGAGPLSEFELECGNLTTAQKETLRTFYLSAQGETAMWSMNFDGIGYSDCRFLNGFDPKLKANKIWRVTLQFRALKTSTQPIPAYAGGAGAPIITPLGAATATVSWNVLWNGISPLAFANGQTTLTFDDANNASLAYIPGSGGEGTTGDATGHYYQKYGWSGTSLVEPNGLLGIGPVSLGAFTPGQEVILQVVTTGATPGTLPGTIFYSGPGWRNADGTAHASVSWTVP